MPTSHKLHLPAAALRECRLAAALPQVVAVSVGSADGGEGSPAETGRVKGRRFIKTPFGTPAAKALGYSPSPCSAASDGSATPAAPAASPAAAVAGPPGPTSPRRCRFALPLHQGASPRKQAWKEHVWFNSPLNSSHPITPYSEVYGVHPRFFNFDHSGNKVSPYLEALAARQQAQEEAERGRQAAQAIQEDNRQPLQKGHDPQLALQLQILQLLQQRQRQLQPGGPTHGRQASAFCDASMRCAAAARLQANAGYYAADFAGFFQGGAGCQTSGMTRSPSMSDMAQACGYEVFSEGVGCQGPFFGGPPALGHARAPAAAFGPLAVPPPR